MVSKHVSIKSIDPLFAFIAKVRVSETSVEVFYQEQWNEL